MGKPKTQEENMVHSTVTQRDLKKLGGKVLRDFSYSVTYDDFLKSSTFKNVKTIAFIFALLYYR